MQPRIFINYRREDDPGFTHAIYQQLEDEFGIDAVFMDVEGYIKPGDDFVEALAAEVSACEVFLAVIGRNWQEFMSARVDDPNDFVRIEIESALAADKRIIPVLVAGASMPQARALPQSIQLLARRNAVALRADRFRADCTSLVRALLPQSKKTLFRWRSLWSTRNPTPRGAEVKPGPIGVSRLLNNFAKSFGRLYVETEATKTTARPDLEFGISRTKLADHFIEISKSLTDYAEALSRGDELGRREAIRNRYNLEANLNNLAYMFTEVGAPDPAKDAIERLARIKVTDGALIPEITTLLEGGQQMPELKKQQLIEDICRAAGEFKATSEIIRLRS